MIPSRVPLALVLVAVLLRADQESQIRCTPYLDAS